MTRDHIAKIVQILLDDMLLQKTRSKIDFCDNFNSISSASLA